MSDQATDQVRRVTVAAIIPAAGTGSRLAADEQTVGPTKALRLLGDRTMIRYAASCLEHTVTQLVVATSPELSGPVETELADLSVAVTVVVGGQSRQESVRRALAALTPGTDLVLVHDAARPLMPPVVADRVVAALLAGARAVVPAVPVADTLRRLDPAGGSHTVDRSSMRAVQTPQGFAVDVLRRAHEGAHEGEATDDASLVEQLGVEVDLVEGDVLGFKVTRLLDLRLAEALVADEASQR